MKKYVKNLMIGLREEFTEIMEQLRRVPSVRCFLIWKSRKLQKESLIIFITMVYFLIGMIRDT